jgi:hypothetical protein
MSSRSYSGATAGAHARASFFYPENKKHAWNLSVELTNVVITRLIGQTKKNVVSADQWWQDSNSHPNTVIQWTSQT